MLTKPHITIILIALVYCLPWQVSAQGVLKKYLDQAIENNLDLKRQDFMYQKSLYALKEAKGLFLPDIELNTSYLTSGGGRKIEIPIGDLLNPVYTSLNNLTNSNQFPQVDNVSQTFNPYNYYDAKLHTTLPLYNAELIYNSRIKKEQVTLQQIELSLYKRELIKQVKLAYYGYLQSLEVTKVLQNGLELATENLRINQSMVKNGKAIRTVISRAENEVTGIKSQIEDANAQSLNAAAYFNFLLNRPLTDVIEIEQPLLSSESDAMAQGKREELASLESAMQISELSLKLNKSRALPKFSTFLDLGAQGDFIKVNKDAPYYLFGVNLSWNLFTGNRNNNKTKQALMDLKASAVQTDLVTQKLQLEVTTTLNKLTAARQSYKAAVSQSSLSKQYYQDQQRLYKEGQALYLELLDAQTRLINDQIKQSIAYLNVQTRETELERAKATYIF